MEGALPLALPPRQPFPGFVEEPLGQYWVRGATVAGTVVLVGGRQVGYVYGGLIVPLDRKPWEIPEHARHASGR